MITAKQKQELFPKYAKLVCQARFWVYTAQCLYAAAEQLEPETNRLWKGLHDSIMSLEQKKDPEPFQASDYQAVYLMLVGYSLENLMKGFLAEKMKSEFSPEIGKTGKLPSILKDHKLDKLAMKCQLKLSSDEVGFLKRLSRHIVWVGRYHFATSAEKFYHLTDSNTIPSSGKAWISNDINEVKKLINNIAKQLRINIRPNGPTY